MLKDFAGVFERVNVANFAGGVGLEESFFDGLSGA